MYPAVLCVAKRSIILHAELHTRRGLDLDWAILNLLDLLDPTNPTMLLDVKKDFGVSDETFELIQKVEKALFSKTYFDDQRHTHVTLSYTWYPDFMDAAPIENWDERLGELLRRDGFEYSCYEDQVGWFKTIPVPSKPKPA